MIKPKLPVKLIVGVIFLGIFIFAFLVFALRSTQGIISDATMRGTVVSKEFIPAGAQEQQITLGNDGSIRASTAEGEFILMVEVPQEDGTKVPYKIWMPDRAQYDAVEVGDFFDVGPRLVR
ncbi:MAG: hypothetical protein WEB60_07400 [Terrimicrobiaceae bacterium]